VSAAQRQESERPELAVVRGRGRPREPYPYLSLAPADARAGDALTVAWLSDYRALFPDDWERMLRTLRKSGGSTTWTEATVRKKSKRDVPDQVIDGSTVLSDSDEPVYLRDLAHLMELYPGINGPQHRGRSIFTGGAYIDPDELARPDYEIGRGLSAEVKRCSFDAELRAILDAIARDEREYLEALHGQSPWLEVFLEELYRLWEASQPIYVAFVPISNGPVSRFLSERTRRCK
jgi:hypothetical protein